MNVIPLTVDEQTALKNAQQAVADAQAAVKTAAANRNRVFNGILDQHKLSTGSDVPILTEDCQFLVTGTIFT
jgi:hypothetical protein